MKTAYYLSAALVMSLSDCDNAFSASPPASVKTAISATRVTVDAIEKLKAAIDKSKKPLPAWAVDMAMRAYATYKTYRNGEKVEAVLRDVHAVLKIVAEIKDQVEAGREMSEIEYRRTRELLDQYARSLDDLKVRVDTIESEHARDRARTASEIARARSQLNAINRSAAQSRARARAWQHFNRVCQQSEHVWRPGQARCLHISVAGRRS